MFVSLLKRICIMTIDLPTRSPNLIEELVDHIQHRTFGRLHDLCVDRGPDGRISVRATANSRFVGQLAEWAVLERMSESTVRLSISVPQTPRRFMEVET